MATKIQIRRGTSTEWAAANPTLADGELAVETDTKQLKIGDGSTAYNSLAYVATGNMDVASSDLDDLADGTTYKRVTAAVATALNAGTYDAASVSAFGIGTTGAVKDADLNTITLGGLYRVVYNAAYNFPTGITSTLAQLLVLPGSDANNFVQILSDRDTYDGLWIRKKVGIFGSWYKIWNTGNDGNGGQPPAPKPRNSANNIGHWIGISNSTGAALNLPAGGKWAYYRLSFVTSSGAIAGTGGGAGLAGGSELGAATSGVLHSAIIWRIE